MEITNIQQLESIATADQITKFVNDIFCDIYLHTLLKRFRKVYKNQKIDKLLNSVFDLSADDEFIIINRSFKHFKKYILQNDIDNLQINNEFIYALIERYLSQGCKNYIEKLINEYNANIDKNSVTEMNELTLANIPIGQSINVNLAFYDNLHKFFIVPVIYVNGNIIYRQKYTVQDYVEAFHTTREYHFHLLDDYLSSGRSKRRRNHYHDNDLKPVHRECTREDIEQDYAYARIVLDNEVCI